MELEILRNIQSIANPFLDILFQLITICGEQMVLVLIISIIYWVKDKKFGEYIAYAVLTSVLVNCVVKDIFKFKRPIGEEGIRALREKLQQDIHSQVVILKEQVHFMGQWQFILKRKLCIL